jgi:hypothetical protein
MSFPRVQHVDHDDEYGDGGAVSLDALTLRVRVLAHLLLFDSYTT